MLFLRVYMQQAVYSHEQTTKQNNKLPCCERKTNKQKIFINQFPLQWICHQDKIWHYRALMCWHSIWMIFASKSVNIKNMQQHSNS